MNRCNHVLPPNYKIPPASVAVKRRMVPIQVHVNNAAWKMLEHHQNRTRRSYGSNSRECQQQLPTLDQLIGAVCKNNGCNTVCTDDAIINTDCVHHRGMPTSNTRVPPAFTAVSNRQQQQQPQYWSCCGRKTTNLLGCVTGKHCWIKRECVDSARHDWFYQAGLVHLSIFCRSTVPQGTHVESDGLKLDITIVHGFGTLVSHKHFDLYAEILPAESKMLISEKKVELILKQAKREQWPRLCYEGADGAVYETEDECVAYLVDNDDDDDTCYAVY